MPGTGTLLWNNQTRQPEWVAADAVESSLSSGTYRTYEGSIAPGDVGAGLTTGITPEKLGGYVATGGQTNEGPTLEERAAANHQKLLATYNNPYDELSTVVDGAVQGFTVNLVSGIGSTEDIANRAEANPYAHAGGALASALASMALPLPLPSTGLFKSGEALAGAVERGITADALVSGRRAVLAKIAAHGAEGAYIGGAYAAGAQINNAVNGRPVSGDAIVDEAGLNGILGGALGGVAGALGARAAKRAETVGAVADLAPAGKLVGDGVGLWDKAHVELRDNYNVLEAVVKKGGMGDPTDAEFWIGPRRDAMAAADRARAKLLRVADINTMSDVQARIDQVMESGSPGKLRKLARAMDEYGSAVSEADSLMRPGKLEVNRLNELDSQFGPTQVTQKPGYERLNIHDPEVAAMARGETPLNPGRNGARDFGRHFPVAEPSGGLGVNLGPATAVGKRPKGPAPTVVSPPPEMPKPGPHPYEEALDFWGKMASGKSPKYPKDLAGDLNGVMQRLEQAGNGRFASPALRAYADVMGVDTVGMGPLAERMVDMWSAKQMAKGVGAGAGTARAGAMGKVGRILIGGLGYKFGGPVGGLLAREAADGILGTVGQLSAAAGRIRTRALDGLARVLTTRNVRRVTQIQAVVAGYDPETHQPTRVFTEKAAALSRAMGNPVATKAAIQRAFEPIAKIDPHAAKAAGDMAFTRMKNLHMRLPVFIARGMLGQPAPPDQDAVAEWELYEAITDNPDLVLKLAAEGRVSQTVIDALVEQHPEFQAELTRGIIDQREAIARSNWQVQASLGRLVGVNLVPETDPLYIQRLQQSYEEEAQKRSTSMGQQQMTNQGAAGMSPNMLPGAIPLPGQVYSMPVTQTTNR